jgi:hypothetical protein
VTTEDRRLRFTFRSFGHGDAAVLVVTRVKQSAPASLGSRLAATGGWISVRIDIGRFDLHFARAGPDGIDNSFYQWATSGTHRMDKANEWLAFAVGAGESRPHGRITCTKIQRIRACRSPV